MCIPAEKISQDGAPLSLQFILNMLKDLDIRFYFLFKFK